MTLREALHFGSEQLKNSPTPRLDTEVLLGFVTNKDRAWILAHDDEALTQTEEQVFYQLLKRRKTSEPVAYLTGQKEFYGRSFFVTPDVLIPRPDSELCISILKSKLKTDSQVTIADIGTGSGCLAITTALEFPKSKVIGIDPSKKALRIAEQNAKNLQANIDFRESSLLDSFEDDSLDIILANLPYLTREDLEDSPTAKDLAFEPGVALLADDEGLALIKECTKQALLKLKPQGRLYLEMMPDQVPIFTEWLQVQSLPFSWTIHKDLAQLDRIVELKIG